MHARVNEFRSRFEALTNEAPRIEELPEGTHTASDAAKAVGCQLEQIAKSMVMDVDGELVLVLTSGPNRVDESALAHERGIDPDTVSPADLDLVKTQLGWSIGGIPPVCHDTTVETYIDPSLLEHEEVWAGGGTPQAVFAIDPTRLQELTDAESVDVFIRE